MCADASRDCSDTPYDTIFCLESSTDGEAVILMLCQTESDFSNRLPGRLLAYVYLPISLNFPKVRLLSLDIRITVCYIQYSK